MTSQEVDTPAKPDEPAESDNRGQPGASDELAARVRALLGGSRRVCTRDNETSRRAQVEQEAFTLNAVSRQLGVSRESLARLLCGLPIHEGTRLVLERRLALWIGEEK